MNSESTAINFRDKARLERARAHAELESNNDERLDFAALALRKSLEYLAYDRLSAYRREINLDIYTTWQPRKVLERLLAMDPKLVGTSKISFAPIPKGEENSSPIRPDDEYVFFGEDVPLSVGVLKKNYDALGYYLHAPTVQQYEKNGDVNSEKLRARCNSVLAEIDKVLGSAFWNSNIGTFAEFECKRCGESSSFRKRSAENIGSTFDTWCSRCDAPYYARKGDNGEFEIAPKVSELVCITEGCEFVHQIWQDQVKVGDQWKCAGCKEPFRFLVSVGKVPTGSA